MKFQLLGKEIEVSEGQRNYMSVYTRFTDMAYEATQAFVKDYENATGFTILSSSYVEKVLNKYTEAYFRNFLMTYVKEAKKLLTSYGVYSVTDQMIFDAVTGATEDFKGITKLNYIYNSFTDELMEKAESDSDGKEFARCLRNAFDRHDFNPAVRHDIMCLCDYVLDYLGKNNVIEIQYVYKKDVEKAAAYYENLKDAVVTEEKRLEILCSQTKHMSRVQMLSEQLRLLISSSLMRKVMHLM